METQEIKYDEYMAKSAEYDSLWVEEYKVSAWMSLCVDDNGNSMSHCTALEYGPLGWELVVRRFYSNFDMAKWIEGYGAHKLIDIYYKQ